MNNSSIEGLGVDIHQARFTGIFDVTEDDDRALSLDRVVVFLVAARSGKIEHTIRDNGDVVAKRILKVTDAMPLTGEVREQALGQLGNRTDPNQLSFGWPSQEPEVVSGEEVTSIEVDEVEVGEPPLIPPAAVWSNTNGEVEIVGRIHAHEKDAQLSKFLQESYQ